MTHQELQMVVDQINDYQVKQIAQTMMKYLTLNDKLTEKRQDCCSYFRDQDIKFIRKVILLGKKLFQ